MEREREDETENGITAREVPEGVECVDVEKERYQQEKPDSLVENRRIGERNVLFLRKPVRKI